VLDNLFVPDAHEVHKLPFHAVAGRRQAPNLAEVRPPERFAGGNEVPFAELLVDLHRRVRERLEQRPVERLEARGRATHCHLGLPFTFVVVHEVRVEDRVGEAEVVLVLAHLHKGRNYPLVVLRRHGFPPPPPV
jgi:hypothetical protein